MSSDATATFFAATKAAGTTVEVDFGDKTIPKRYALGYWSIRGLGGPLTMMLCAAKIPFTLFLFELEKKGENGWTSEYFAAKREFIKKYKQPLWNLPFCVDRENERVIVQSNAIWTHLGRACGMLDDVKNNDTTLSECEELLGEIYDLRNVMTGHVYGTREDDPTHVLANARDHLKKLEGWLELQALEDSSSSSSSVVVHLVNGKFTPPDFHLWELLDQFEGLAKEVNRIDDFFQDLPRIKAFKDGFAKLPENSFYLNSWLHKELPMYHFESLTPGPKTYIHGESAQNATWRNKGIVELSPSLSEL